MGWLEGVDMRLDNKGISLIELLIGLSLITMVAAAIYGIYISGITTFSIESSNARNQINIRQAISYISKELRKSSNVEVVGETLIIDGSEYELVEGVIKKDNTDMFFGISEFNVIKDGNKVTLRITSIPNIKGKDVTLETEIFIRE